jgi:transcriptional regulator with XRE-family HTH domain
MSLEEMKKRLNLSEEEQDYIRTRAQTLIDEELTLRDLRKAHHFTQERLAELLDIEQDGVSRIEHRENLLLSTLSSYVEAMGGKLRLVAEFPDRSPVTVRLGDLSDFESPRSKRRRLSTDRKKPTGKPSIPVSASNSSHTAAG